VEKKNFKQKMLTLEFTKSSNVVMQMGVVMDMVILEGKIESGLNTIIKLGY
jgi:hypothetical protein